MAYVFQKKYRRKDGTVGKCKKWTIRYYDRHGQQHERPGFRDRRASEARALELERDGEREEAGVRDPFEEHRATPITEHLEAFREHLRRRGRDKTYTGMKLSRIQKVLVNAKRLSDITEDRVLDALKALPDAKTAQTRNHYLQAVKQFTRWAVAKKRLRDNPLTGVEAENTRVDPERKERRALTVAEVSTLLESTMVSRKVFRRLKGSDRAVLYLVAVSTGLRSGELASLKVSDFMLDDESPAIRLSAIDDKSRRGVEQPVPRDITPVLKRYLVSREASDKVWGSSWHDQAYKMVKSDLVEAKIPHKTAEGIFDFHALRHTYISLLATSQLQPKMVQDLARHSDIRLTMSRYAHTVREQRSKAVSDSFPLLFPLKRANQGELVIRSENDETQNEAENLVLPIGFEPTTLGLGNRCSIP
jgi:integrase